MAGRVLFVTGEYPPLRGGVGDYTQRLAQELVARGWAVEIATRQLPIQPSDGLPVRWQLTSWGRPLWQMLRELRRSGWRGILHLQYQAGAFDLQGRVALLPLLARPLPVVTTFHDTRVPYLFPKAGPLRQLALRLLARTSAAVVVTNAEDERELLRWGGLPQRLVRIPIGSNLPHPRDPAGARARVGLKPDQPVVAFFGFRSAEKGLATLVQALALCPEPRPTLLLLGGEQPDVPGAASEPAVPATPVPLPVLDLGYRPAQEVADLLAAADLVVLPFRRGASLRHGTLIAALSCGAAVVTTTPAEPALLAPLKASEHLRLVPPEDPQALARVLTEFLGSPQERARLRSGARAIAPCFAWERIVAAHLECYEAVLLRASLTD
uniref:Glycosyltransferase n=1 Tax=Thermomicrobium roseum TaxID=500 RepID=A0A7C2B1S9_THERO